MPFVPSQPDSSWLLASPCSSPEHDPPTMIVLPPGQHTYVCPNCGEKTTFVVPEIRC